MEDPVRLHKKLRGKIDISPKIKKIDKDILSLIYTPGVAEASEYINKNPEESFSLTIRSNTVAIVSDSTRVLGLGKLRPEAGLPVIESKALLFKLLANVNAFPIVVKERSLNKLEDIICSLEPTFGGINLEDIESPKVFYLYDYLRDCLNIPIFHDDRHGTGIVIYAGLLNALRLVNKDLSESKIVVIGSGAAALGFFDLIKHEDVGDIIFLDSKGILHKNREDLNIFKRMIAENSNFSNIRGNIKDAIKEADVLIGVSGKSGIIKPEYIRKMNKNPIIFALSNPNPEIKPEYAYKAGAYIVATGRSDYPNQLNNALVFPYIFRYVLDKRLKKINLSIMRKYAIWLSKLIHPTKNKILPEPYNPILLERLKDLDHI